MGWRRGFRRVLKGGCAVVRAARTYELEVTLPGGGVKRVAVTEKRVRRLNLRARADGSVVLSVPAGTAPASARSFLEHSAAWLERALARSVRKRAAAEERRREPLISRTGADAGTLPLWGRLVPATEVLGADAPQLADDELAQRIDALYRREVARALPVAATRYEAALGVHAARWSVRTMETRWGSCTPATGSIRMCSRLAAYPPACLDSVVAHELVHLLEPSHNARFHALLDEVCPGNRDARRILKCSPREACANGGTALGSEHDGETTLHI